MNATLSCDIPHHGAAMRGPHGELNMSSNATGWREGARWTFRRNMRHFSERVWGFGLVFVSRGAKPRTHGFRVATPGD